MAPRNPEPAATSPQLLGQLAAIDPETLMDLDELKALQFSYYSEIGANHRFGLDDAVLIKDNHRIVAGGVAEAVRRVRRYTGHMVKIEVEVDTLGELEEALASGVDAILLDNMPLPMLTQAVALAKGKALTEASGGITQGNAAEIAATGVDLLPLGWLTHSAPALDVSLDISVQV